LETEWSGRTCTLSEETRRAERAAAGVRALVVAMKRGNARRAKERREVET
jgi:hypothetical protein